MDVRRGGRTGKAAAGAEGVGRPRRDTARLAGGGLSAVAIEPPASAEGASPSGASENFHFVLSG